MSPQEPLLTSSCLLLAEVRRLELPGPHDRAQARKACFQPQLLSRQFPAEMESRKAQHFPG